MESVVRCTGITKTYHSGDVDTKALRGVDLEIRAGELFMLVGPSGCGKTTLISIIAGILEYDQGRCEVLGHELHSLTERERSLHRGLNLGFVFQAFNLIPTLTITENVAIPLLLQRKNRNEAMERAQHLLKEVGLAEKCQRSPRDLSGGQQQRVAIARALVHDPKIIVCDEPTSSLDQDTGHHILELFREVALSRGRTVIIVTHDTRIFGFADRIGRMNDGLVEEVKSVPMIRKYILPLLAVVGFFFGIRTIISGRKTPPVMPPLVEPARPTFEKFVAGAGLVESSTENIAIGAPVGGVVQSVPVTVGTQVRKGDILFVLDERDVRSEFTVRKSSLDLARAELTDAQEQFALWQSLKDTRAVSKEDFIRRKNSVEIYRAKLKVAEGEYDRAKTELERRTVVSPIDGEVLQVKIRVGEFAPAASMSLTPLMLLGSTQTLHVRVDIDESDAWRVQAGAKAVGHLRGNPELSTPLEFVRFEPYVIPKRNLTGESSERVDTRVLQVLYRFTPGSFPVYVGQVMDIFIEEKGKP